MRFGDLSPFPFACKTRRVALRKRGKEGEREREGRGRRARKAPILTQEKQTNSRKAKYCAMAYGPGARIPGTRMA